MTRIDTYSSGGFSDLRFWGLFSTEQGAKFKEQIKSFSGFVFICSFLSFPADELKQAWIRVLKTGEIEKLRSIADPKDDFDKFIEQMKTLFSLAESDDETDLSRVFGRREMRRFLALLSLSAFAYVESYSISILKHVEEEQRVEKIITTYLSQNEFYDNRTETRILTIKQVKNLGLGLRLEILSDAIDTFELSKSNLSEGLFKRYQKLMKYFIRLRGKMAHGDPEPSLKRFDHEFFKKVYEEIRLEFLGMLDEWQKVPEPLVAHFDILAKWFQKIIPTLAVIYAVPNMIVTYVSLIDAIIDYHMRNTSEE